MIRPPRISPLCTVITWMLVLLMVEPQTRIVGQESSTYIRALEVILAPSPTKLAASSILLLTAASDPGRPTLAPITNQTINVGQRLSVTVKATDRDVPTQTLQFSLLEKPAGATVRTIRGTNAVIGWTPTRDSADTTNRFTVVVSDNGTPSLSATQSFQVIVTDFAQSALGTTVIQAGQDGCLPLTIDSSETITNIEMTIRWPLGTFTNFTVTPTAPQICSATLQSVSPTQAVVRLFTCPGQSLTLTQAVDLADLCFTALPGQPSAFVPLIITNSTVRTLAGNQITNRAALAGTVVVVGSDPLLEIARTADQGRQLFLYANPGRFYQIDSTTNLSDSAAWQLACRVPMTGPALVLCCVDLTGPTKFFRARELGAGPTNEPPRVDAGPDQIISTNITTLHGSATDDGLPAGCKPLTYAWSRVSGPGPATFSNPTSAVTTVSFGVRGTYVFRLSASDTQSTNSDDLTISAPSFNCSLAEEEGWLARVSSPLPPASAGSVLFNNCTIVLNEGGSFEVAAEKTFVIPATPSMLVLTYETPTFDSTSTGLMRDAFEVALVDAAGRPLTFTIQGEAGLTPASVISPAVLPPSPDALFNHTDGKPPFIARGSAVTPTIGGARQLSMDVSHLAPGTAAKLILRLVNNDRDRISSVRIAAVSFQSIPPSQTPPSSLGAALSLLGPATSILGNNNPANPCPPSPLRFQTSGTPTQGTSLTCVSPPSDLIAWWPGDNNTDDVIGGNNGTLRNGATFGLGIVGSAFNFDGTNDFVEIPHNPSLDPRTNSFTVEAWIQTTNLSGSIAVKYECGGSCPNRVAASAYAISLNLGRLSGWFRNHEPNGEDSRFLFGNRFLADGQFHHVALIRDQVAGLVRVYVDGNLDVMTNLTAAANGDITDDDGEPDPLLIGAYMEAGQQTKQGFFRGIIDEVALYNRALTSGEIAAIYAAGIAGMCKPNPTPGLVVPSALSFRRTGITATNIIVPSNFLVEVFAEVPLAGALAIAPSGSPFATGLFVSTGEFQDPAGPQTGEDHIMHISHSGSVSSFATLLPEADPAGLEFPPLRSPFGDYLYVSSNNRDGGRSGPHGGTIQRVDVSGSVADFTAIGLPNGPGEPSVMVFGRGDFYGTDLYVANSSASPSDIIRVQSSGSISAFVNDGLVTPSGMCPVSLDFGRGGAFGSNLFFIDLCFDCRCIRAAQSNGAFGPPLGQTSELPLAMRFAPGSSFGSDLYVTVVSNAVVGGDLRSSRGGAIYKMKADGTLTLFATGFAGFAGVGYGTADNLEFTPDGSSLFVADHSGGKIYRIFPADEEARERIGPTLVVESPSDNARLAPGGALLTGSVAISDPFQSTHPTAVEWPISNGGNGHYYEPVVRPEPISWTDAQLDASTKGGYLATLTSSAENTFVFGLVNDPAYWYSAGVNTTGPWLGGYQPQGSTEPAGGWRWINDEGVFTDIHWAEGEPNNNPGSTIGEDRLVFFSPQANNRAPLWNDLGDSAAVISYVIEYERVDVEPNRITLVTVNGTPVDALDAAGNFFSSIDVRPGQNVFEVVATDAFNQSTTNAVTVYGTTCPQNFASLGEVSASVVPDYGRTSFNEWTRVLYADLALRNAGTYPIRAPFYVGVTRISDPSVKLIAPDGVSADGIPYYDFSATLTADSLTAGSLTAPRALAFHNPNKVQFTYDFVVLGQLNQAPAFNTTPTLEAIAGKPYTYAFNATDPDGDALNYSLTTGPAGLTLNSQLQALNWSPLAINLGTHDIRLRADDGKGGIAEQHYLLSVINQPSNRPPFFVSTPVTVAHVSTNLLTADAWLDLRTWTTNQNPGTFGNGAATTNAGVWAISSDGLSVTQRVNADATMLVSDFELSNESIEGTWRVTSGGEGEDDDFMGFVFGYQDATHFYLFDWKQGDQMHDLGSFAQRGMSVKIVEATPPLTALDLWPTTGSTGRITPLFHNTIPWAHDTDYTFRLDFRDGEFTILVRQGTNTLAVIQLFDSTYTTGRFGFYNYSQGNVRYTGFTRRALPEPTYVYDADARDPDSDPLTYSLLVAPTHMTIDPLTGLIRWAPPAEGFDEEIDTGSNDPTLPFVPGFRVETYSDVPDPQQITFDLSGNLFVGRDNSGSGGDPADAVRIHKVARTNRQRSEYGNLAIPDPDSVLYDALGRISGVPGSVLVGGVSAQGGLGLISAIPPDMNVKSVFGPSAAVGNVSYMTFDNQGRLIFYNLYTRTLLRSDGGQPVVIFEAPVVLNGLAIDAAGRIFVLGQDGIIRVYREDGTLENGAFATGLIGASGMAFGPGGVWGTDLYVCNANSAELVRFSGSGVGTVVGTGVEAFIPAFGPDGALYLSDFNRDRILRVSPSRRTLGVMPGEHLVTVAANDSHGGVTYQSYRICVLPAEGNRAPIIVSEPIVSFLAGQTYATDVDALDPDGDLLTYSLEAAPQGMSIDSTNGQVTWTPNSGFLTNQTITFFDGDFAAANWELTTLTHGRGGLSSGTHEPTGGNPGSFRHVVMDHNGADHGDLTWLVGFHKRVGAIYRPREQGAIFGVDFSIDTKRLLASPYIYNGLPIGPALKQNGKVYIAWKTLTSGLSTAWTNRSLTGLQAGDFALVVPSLTSTVNPGSNPDFSTNGADVELGFFAENNSGFGTPSVPPEGFGVDNWVVKVTPNIATSVAVSVKDSRGGSDSQRFSLLRSGGATIRGVVFDDENANAAWERGQDVLVAASSGIKRFNSSSGLYIDDLVPQGSGGLNNAFDWMFGPDTNLYVCSYWTDEVKRYDGRTGQFIDNFAFGGGLRAPSGLTFGPDGNLYVSSEATDQILRYDGRDGHFIGAFANAPSLVAPRKLGFGPGGHLYVAYWNSGQIAQFDGTSGAPAGIFASGAGLNGPADFKFGPDGNLYVTSANTDQVLRFRGSDGGFMDYFIVAGSGGLDVPFGLVFGPDGNLYVAGNLPGKVLRYQGNTGAFLGSLTEPQTLFFQKLGFSKQGATIAPELGLSGWTVYLDLNGNRRRDLGEPFTLSGANGEYRFDHLPAGNYIVRQERKADWHQTGPIAEQYEIALSEEQIVHGLFFGNAPGDSSESNRPPRFVSTPPQTGRAASSVVYRASAVDLDGDILTFDLVAYPEGMLVETNSGAVAWRPLLSQLGTHEVILRVQDGRGGVAIQSWQITVSAPNSPPFITTFPSGPAVVGLPYRYAIRAQDPESQPLTFALTTNAPAGLTLIAGSSNSALLSWTPALAQLGTNPVEIIVRDSEGGEARQSFGLEVVVSAPNRPPAITSTPRTQTRVGSPYAYVVEVSDPDGDPVTVTLLSGPSGMVVTNLPVTDGAESLPTIYWPGAELGSYTVLLRASDGRSGTADQQFTLNVASSLNNQPPLITSLPLEHATAGQTYDYQLAASDPDGDTVTWRMLTGPVGMSLDSATGRLLWIPTLEQMGTNAVVIEVTDTLLATATQTISIDVGCLNRPPQITSVPPTTAQTGEPYLYAPRGNDPDGDRLSWSLVPGQFPLGMTIDGTNGLVRWTPTTNQVGGTIVSVRVTDGRGGNDTQTFTLYAANLRANQAPYFVSAPVTVAQINTSGLETIGSFDLTRWSVVQFSFAGEVARPAQWSIDLNNATTGLARQLANSDPSILLSDTEFGPRSIIEGNLRVDTETDNDWIGFAFGFQDTNRFYVFDWTKKGPNTPSVMRVRKVHATGPLSRVDFEAQTSQVTTLFQGTKDWTAFENFSFRLEIRQDSLGILINSSTGIVQEISLTGLTELSGKFGFYNYSQEQVEYSASIRQAMPTYSYDSDALDSDSDSLSYLLATAPTGMTINATNGLIRWAPTTNQIGTHPVMVVATDGQGGSGIQNYFVQVLAPRTNRPPQITSSPRTNAIPTIAYRYDLGAFDPDGDALIYALVAPVPSGLAIDNLGRISWTPSFAQTGVFPITVTASDSFGASTTQAFNLFVTADTEPPVVSLAVGYNLNDAAGNRFVQIGTEVPVRVQVSDNVGVASRELRVAGQVIPLSASGGASVLFPTSGPIPAIAQAVDFSGNVTFTTNVVQVVDPNAASTVAIVIHSPTNTTEVTRAVPVIATITSQVPLFDYQVEFAPIDSDMPTMELSMDDPRLVFQTITNVTLPLNTFGLTNVTLGRFDPLMLLNGAYVIRVSAFDQNRQGQREGVIVNVAGNLKFGEFRLEFTDLTIPVAGIPITVKRVYDTRESRRQGDFGHGWSLGVQDARILEIGKRPFYGFDDEGTTFTTRTRVYMTTPDGRRVGFNFTPQFAGGSFIFGAFFRPAFTADPGVYDRLEAVPADAGYQIESDGSVSTGFGLVGLDPATYRLTTRDNLVYDYDQRGGLQRVIDPNGNRLLYTRDGIFHYSAGAVDSDQSIRFVRDAQGRIAQIIDPTGKILRYTYDAAGDLHAFADQVTNVTQYAYSQARAHFLTNIIDPLGYSALRMDYDASGRLTGVRDANGNPITQDFNSDSNTGTYQDGNGNVTVVKYDEQGNEIVRMLPGISTNYFGFDSNNNLLASTNGRGFSTNFTYDARGNVTSISDSLSNRTTIAYSAQNKPVGVTNALGQVISLAYNSSGQLTQVVNNAGFKTSVSRDGMGRVASLTDATGTNTTIFDYNGGCACGKPGKVINPDGSFKLNEYNSLGQVTREVNELGAEKLSFFDDTGKLLWTRDPLTNYTQFFYRGPLLTNVVDALGRSTRYEYDSLNRTNKIIDAENGVVEFRYDNNGNRTHVIDAVTNVTTFVYDSANRLKMQIDPLGHTNFFDYDAAANRTEAIDRNGRKRTFRYDAANRMTNELWWEGTNVVRSIVFGFNELGVQTLAADPAARYTYSYDSLNRLERVLSQSAGVPDFTLLYTYTKLGQVESVTDNWGVRVGSGYDNRNRLSQRTWHGPGVDAARVDFAFDVTGNRTRTDRYADLAGANRIGFTTNAYNHAGIVTNITHAGPTGTVLAKYDYHFDAAYQIRNWTINNQPSAFEYDRTGQLTNALNTAQPNENFRFDANGNRVGVQSGGSYVVGRNNQVLSDGTNRYAYDLEGNMTVRSNTVTGVLTTYQWDHRNRLMNLLDRNPVGVVTQTVAFVYDAMNRRLSKTVNAPQATNVVRFLYNQDDSWADLDGTNAVIARYLHGARIDELLARQRASDGRGWYLTDHLGTVRDIANAAGAVVAHVDFSSFGRVLGVSNPGVVDRFLFTGRELDGETGLYFYRARYYSAQIGRFVSNDPIGFSAGDLNLYRYVRNAPIFATDPSGQAELTEAGVIRILQSVTGTLVGTTSIAVLVSCVFVGTAILGDIIDFVTDPSGVISGKLAELLDSPLQFSEEACELFYELARSRWRF